MDLRLKVIIIIEALNIPPLHPARSYARYFLFADNTLLRSQMSLMQIHVMENMQPPLRIIAMGRVYQIEILI